MRDGGQQTRTCQADGGILDGAAVHSLFLVWRATQLVTRAQMAGVRETRGETRGRAMDVAEHELEAYLVAYHLEEGVERRWCDRWRSEHQLDAL